NRPHASAREGSPAGRSRDGRVSSPGRATKSAVCLTGRDKKPKKPRPVLRPRFLELVEPGEQGAQVDVGDGQVAAVLEDRGVVACRPLSGRPGQAEPAEGLLVLAESHDPARVGDVPRPRRPAPRYPRQGEVPPSLSGSPSAT